MISIRHAGNSLLVFVLNRRNELGAGFLLASRYQTKFFQNHATMKLSESRHFLQKPLVEWSVSFENCARLVASSSLGLAAYEVYRWHPPYLCQTAEEVYSGGRH